MCAVLDVVDAGERCGQDSGRAERLYQHVGRVRGSRGCRCWPARVWYFRSCGWLRGLRRKLVRSGVDHPPDRDFNGHGSLSPVERPMMPLAHGIGPM